MGAVAIIIGTFIALSQTPIFKSYLIIECPRTFETDDLITSKHTINQIVEQGSFDIRWGVSRDEAIKRTFESLDFEMLEAGKCRITARSEEFRDPMDILTTWKEQSLDPQSEMLIKKSKNPELLEKFSRILHEHELKGSQLKSETLSDEEHEKLRLQYISDKDGILALKKQIKEDGINLDSYQTILEDDSDTPSKPDSTKQAQITQLAGILAFIPALIYFLRKSLRPLDNDKRDEAV